LRAYLDLVRAPDELPGPALAGLLNRPVRYVNASTVEAVTTAARPWAHLRSVAAREASGGPRPLSAVVELVEALRPGLATALAPEAAPSAGPDAVSSTVPAVAPTSDDCVWTVVEAFALDDLWAAEADAAAAGDGAGSDGAGPLEVFDSLLLLAQTYPDPVTFLRTWDRLLSDEQAHLGVADDTLAREESEDDLVVIGTIHAAKGREYDAIVIPDYDCDVSRWSAAEVEEERRVVYVGVTRARDAALFTVDSSSGFVHPFLRELVEQPEPGEHDALKAWQAEEPAAELRARIAERIAEIEVLFPELVADEAAPAARAADGAAGGPPPPEVARERAAPA
jgi:superfamily I DNA/RNA helicase